MWHDMVRVHDIYDTSSDKQVPVSWQHPQHYGKVQNSSVWVHLFVSLWNKANHHSVNIKRTTGITKGLLINASTLSLSLLKKVDNETLLKCAVPESYCYLPFNSRMLFFLWLLVWPGRVVEFVHIPEICFLLAITQHVPKTSKTWRSKTRYRAAAFSKKRNLIFTSDSINFQNLSRTINHICSPKLRYLRFW